MEQDKIDSSYSQISRKKITFVGNISVGKTSIIKSILGEKFPVEYEPSIGVDYFSKIIKYKGSTLKLQIWDSAGQEKFKSLIPNYIRGSSLIFLVYDISNKKSFKDLQKWIDFINEIENTIIILCANKIDLKDNRVISPEEGEKYAKEKGLKFFEVSAKEETNIQKMIYSSLAEIPFFQSFSSGNTTKEEIIKDLIIQNNENSQLGHSKVPDNSKILNIQGMECDNNIQTKASTEVNECKNKKAFKKRCKC